jgi:hypothetical protein
VDLVFYAQNEDSWWSRTAVSCSSESSGVKVLERGDGTAVSVHFLLQYLKYTNQLMSIARTITFGLSPKGVFLRSRRGALETGVLTINLKEHDADSYY